MTMRNEMDENKKMSIWIAMDRKEKFQERNE
jgi:hypothetical protein